MQEKQNKTKIFVIRLDKKSEESLAGFAQATHRTKAQAARAAIQIAYNLFVEGAATEIGAQAKKQIA